MITTFSEVEKAVFKLSDKEKLLLVQDIMLSFSDNGEAEAWYDEAEARLLGVRAGRSKLHDGDGIMRELKAKFAIHK
jgi:hypothetical protein